MLKSHPPTKPEFSSPLPPRTRGSDTSLAEARAINYIASKHLMCDTVRGFARLVRKGVSPGARRDATHSNRPVRPTPTGISPTLEPQCWRGPAEGKLGSPGALPRAICQEHTPELDPSRLLLRD